MDEKIRPASDELRVFQPGVKIDWRRPAVFVDGRVVLRSGPIEFLACFAGKEHESIIRLGASAEHVYLAMGLIGLQPGRPPGWDEASQQYTPATGGLLNVEIECSADGEATLVPAFDWLRGCEFARSPPDRPWVFSGSRRSPDGTLAADHTGEGFAVVDMPNSLVCLSRSRSSNNDALWVEANESAIPPVSVQVRLVLTPARIRRVDARMDFRGALFINDRYAQIEDLAELIDLNLRLAPEYVQTINSEAAFSADIENLRSRLSKLGIPEASVHISTPSIHSPTGQTAHPE